MNKERFYIEYPISKSEKSRWCKEYGLNAYYSGVHWSVRKRDAEFWHKLTINSMLAQGFNPRQLHKKPVIITFYWNDRLDIDNHAAMGKMIVDALKGKVIEDDNKRWLKGVCHFFHDEPFITVEITEV